MLVGLQSVVNAVGSFLMVAGLQRGLPGVAAATVAGQWLGAVLMLRALSATQVQGPTHQGMHGHLCSSAEPLSAL